MAAAAGYVKVGPEAADLLQNLGGLFFSLKMRKRGCQTAVRRHEIRVLAD